ncbi:MAG: hypothetical protein ABIJ45_02855 [Candidatus Zixiibacteriota bacterium]
MKKIMIVLILVLMCAGSTWATYRTVKNLEIPAEGIEFFEIDCGDGMLLVEGMDGLKNIEVEVEIIISGMKSEKAEKMVEGDFDFSLKNSKNRAFLVSEMETTETFFSIPVKSKLVGREDVEMFVKVKVPRAIQLDIVAGATEIYLSDIDNDIRLEGGLGELTLENINGDIEVVSNRNSQTIYIDDDLVYYDDFGRDIISKNVTGKISYYDKSGNYIGDYKDFQRNRKKYYISDNQDYRYFYAPELNGLQNKIILPYMFESDEFDELPELPELPEIPELPELPELPDFGERSYRTVK